MTIDNKNTKYDYDNPNSHFSGIIYEMDFNTMFPVSHNLANRIASDLMFDKHCRKNEETRNKRMKENKEQ